MLNLILSARGARGCRSAQALPQALKNVSFTHVKYKLLPLKCTQGITGSPYLGMLPMHSGPLISKTPWKPQINFQLIKQTISRGLSAHGFKYFHAKKQIQLIKKGLHNLNTHR